MRQLIEMLYAIDDVKSLDPYIGQTGDVLTLEAKINDKAQSVREHVIYVAMRYLA